MGGIVGGGWLGKGEKVLFVGAYSFLPHDQYPTDRSGQCRVTPHPPRIHSQSLAAAMGIGPGKF